ncbi:MAG: hypothetical protein KAT43_01225 [Nanoarchaeota archaeon]|nr:hypothetical protein [Nanoarchaeota archaeon]
MPKTKSGGHLDKMKIIDATRKQMKLKGLTPNHADNLIKEFELIITEEREGFKNISSSDIDTLKILRILLEKLQDIDKDSISFASMEWREKNLNLSKLEKLVEELEMNGISTQSLKSFGGHIYFEVLDKIQFRDYIYLAIDEIIAKLKSPQKEPEEKGRKHHVTVKGNENLIIIDSNENIINSTVINNFKLIYEIINKSNISNKEEVRNKVTEIESEIEKENPDVNIIKKAYDYIKKYASIIVPVLQIVIPEALKRGFS